MHVGKGFNAAAAAEGAVAMLLACCDQQIPCVASAGSFGCSMGFSAVQQQQQQQNEEGGTRIARGGIDGFRSIEATLLEGILSDVKTFSGS
jgi:hypothetical protein